MADTILIAAWSGRMLAASARRAGLAPLVVDAFGDEDTQALAANLVVLPEAIRQGFRHKPLAQALSRLAAEAPSPPLGLVLGAGFEESPALVASLARHWRLLGNSPEAIAKVKSPATFFATLRELGIPHPETSLAPPTDGQGWLSKRIGGSGGGHVVPCSTHPRARAHRYYQRYCPGQTVSLSGVVAKSSLALGFVRTWTAPHDRHPYRFGGVTGPIECDEDAEARMIDIALSLVRSFDLCGLVTFDYVLRDGEPLLLEINPRPGASLDVLDDPRGSLFAAHLGACLGGTRSSAVLAGPRPEGGCAMCYVYADATPLLVPALTWPDVAQDRPSPRTHIAPHQPIASVRVTAATPAAAEASARQAADDLKNLLYSTNQKLETLP